MKAPRQSAAAPWSGALLACLMVTAAATQVSAQDVACGDDEAFPCGFQFERAAIQPVPGLMKFQSRVSQARLPLGDATFQNVTVRVRAGESTKCEEDFTNVEVRNSVLNLEIGRNISCDLSTVIAENNQLKFEVCLGGEDSCLRALDFGVTPYAFKSDYALLANQANTCNVAATSNYASRVTADRDLNVRSKLGTGYFDFYTHPFSDASGLYQGEFDYSDYENSGFIQWTPVSNEAHLTVHIVAKGQDDKLVKLDEFVVMADKSILNGDLEVKGGATVDGGASFGGDVEVGGALVSRGEVTADAGLGVNGDGSISGGLDVGGDAEVGGVLNVVGALQFNGDDVDLGRFVQGTPDWVSAANNGVRYSAGPVLVGRDVALRGTDYALDVEGNVNISSGRLDFNGVPTLQLEQNNLTSRVPLVVPSFLDQPFRGALIDPDNQIRLEAREQLFLGANGNGSRLFLGFDIATSFATGKSTILSNQEVDLAAVTTGEDLTTARARLQLNTDGNAFVTANGQVAIRSATGDLINALLQVNSDGTASMASRLGADMSLANEGGLIKALVRGRDEVFLRAGLDDNQPHSFGSFQKEVLSLKHNLNANDFSEVFLNSDIKINAFQDAIVEARNEIRMDANSQVYLEAGENGGAFFTILDMNSGGSLLGRSGVTGNNRFNSNITFDNNGIAQLFATRTAKMTLEGGGDISLENAGGIKAFVRANDEVFLRSGLPNATPNAAVLLDNDGVVTLTSQRSVGTSSIVLTGSVAQEGPTGTAGIQLTTDGWVQFNARDVYLGGNEIHNSDSRLKEVQGHSDRGIDLALIRQIEITDYTLLEDQDSKTPRKYKKVIAQQVESVFPQAVRMRPGEIPDIFAEASHVVYDGDRKEWTVFMAQDHGLHVGERVALGVKVSDRVVEEVLQVPDSRSFVISQDKAPVGEIFVYGRQVDDLRGVDYEALAMLNISATQEIDRRVTRLETLQSEVEALRAENAELRARFDELAELRDEMKAMRAQWAQRSSDDANCSR